MRPPDESAIEDILTVQDDAVVTAECHRGATVVKPVGFATGDWEGSRCGIRTRIALQNPVAQVVVAILWGHGPFGDTRTGGMLIGYARVFTQETREESPEKRRRTPLTTFWAAETQLGTHSLCQEPSETGALSPSTLVRNAPLSVQNRTNLPDTLTCERTWGSCGWTSKTCAAK